MAEDTIKEADQISDYITYQDVVITLGFYASEESQTRQRLLANINNLTKSKANNDGDSLKYALKILEDYRWLVSNKHVSQTDSALGKYKRLVERYNKLVDENNELKKDNATLLEKYAKLEGKFEYCSDELKKMREAFRGQVKQ